jgi:hypothetical protein
VISSGYAELNRALFRRDDGYGTGGARHRTLVLELIEDYECESVLDFGAGAGCLGNAVMGRDRQHPPPKGVTWHDYEPADPRKLTLPESADLVVSTHVLEHVEPELLHATLFELDRIARKVLYIAVPHRPSARLLPDGRNAHLTLQSAEWWHEMLGEFFGSEPRRLPPVMLVCGLPRDETRYVIEVAR